MRRILLAAILATAFPANAGPYFSTGMSINSADESAMAPEIAVGYAFGRFSVEAGTFAIGTIKRQQISEAVTPPMLSRRVVNEWNLDGFRITARLAFPLNEQWSVFGMVSAYRIEYDFGTAVDTSFDAGGGNVVFTHTGTSSPVREWTPAIGVGMEYIFNACCSVFGAVERIQLKPGTFGQGNDLPNMTSVHMDIKFSF